jgi:hypothetical protein
VTYCFSRFLIFDMPEVDTQTRIERFGGPVAHRLLYSTVKVLRQINGFFFKLRL